MYTYNVTSTLTGASVAYDPDRLTVTGEFYDPETVYIGDTSCPIVSSKTSEIVCEIPKALFGRLHVTVVTVYGGTESVPITLELRVDSKTQAYQSGQFGGTYNFG